MSIPGAPPPGLLQPPAGTLFPPGSMQPPDLGGVTGGVPLYNPTPSSPKTQGGRLKEMLREGRTLVNQQRARWQRNREAYRGNIYLTPTVSGQWGATSDVSNNDYLGLQRGVINRLRQFVDGRVAMLAAKMPAAEVQPPKQTQEALDGARVAEELVEWEWTNVEGWNIGEWMRALFLCGEQDGIIVANVLYDRSQGPMCEEMIALDPQSGQPIGPISTYEQARAALEQDPKGEKLWKPQFYPCGDVIFRFVRAGALAFDPAWQSDWKECGWVIESRRRSISDVERLIGGPIEQYVGDQHKRGIGGRTATSQTIDTGDGSGARMIDTRYECIVHELYAKATPDTGEWPVGAHIMWLDNVQDKPIIEEPFVWPTGETRKLPYRPFIPRPDRGVPLKAKGTVEELLPIAIEMHRRLQQYADWMELVAKPMLVSNGGVLRSPSVFNIDRWVETSPGMGTPEFMRVPPDPGASLLSMVQFYEQQMAAVANVQYSVGGEFPSGIRAAAVIQMLVAQDEQQMSHTEEALKEVVEWAIGEALTNVQHYFTISRQIAMPGVNDEAAFQSFEGSAISGANRWKIVEPMQPKSKQMQQQMLAQFLQYSQGRFDLTPFIKEFVEGDVDAITKQVNQQVRKQEGENRQLATIGSRDDVDQLYQNFTMMRDQYVQMMQQLEVDLQERQRETGIYMDPQNIATQMNIHPPRILDMLKQAGVRVPAVEPLVDRAVLHCAAMERWMEQDGFNLCHPAVQQAAREHFTDHITDEARNAKAIAGQGSDMTAMTPGAQPPQAPAGEETSNVLEQAAPGGGVQGQAPGSMGG